MSTTTIKRYSELIQFLTFEERFDYLKLDGIVSKETFGSSRWLNQQLYHSDRWRKFRDQIIIRDLGCDLGLEGFEIFEKPIIHHLNPLTIEDITCQSSKVFDPENVICTAHKTHNAIHYGDFMQLDAKPIERFPGDTILWHK